jgi:Predicted outer membrane protein
MKEKSLIQKMLCGILMLAVIFGILSPSTARASEGVPTIGSLTIVVDSDGRDSGNVAYAIWQVDPNEERPKTAEEGKAHRIEGSRRQGSPNANGEIVFSNLPIGVYYVEQILLDENEIFQTEPFLVDVPMTDNNGTDWIADIKVYLKHASLYIDKFVGPSGDDSHYDISSVKASKYKSVAHGETFSWYIESYVPSGIAKTPGTYQVTNPKSKEFTHDMDSISVFYIASEKTPLSEGIQLHKDQEYTLTDTAQAFTVELTESGKKMAENAYCRFLLIKFDSQIREDAAHGITHKEGATVSYTLRNDLTDGPGQATAEARIASVSLEPGVHTGKIKLTKLDDSNKEEVLQGAEFGLAETKDAAEKGDFIRTGITQEDGTCVFEGLRYGDIGDEAHENSANTTFWLVETKAPTGYQKLDNPVEVEFQHVEGDNENYFANIKVYDVPLEKAVTPIAPPKIIERVKTGDAAPIVGCLMLILGSALVVVIVLRRRKKQA